MDIIASLSGPMGGAMAGAFGAGVVSGYGFASRTIINESRKRILALEADLKEVRNELMEHLRLGK